MSLFPARIVRVRSAWFAAAGVVVLTSGVAAPPAQAQPFANPITYTLPNTSADGITVGDFNGDGRPDIAASQWNLGTIYVLNGVGDGTFAAPALRATPQYPSTLAAGRFNGDAVDDLIAITGNVAQLYVGTISTGALAPRTTGGTSYGAGGIATGDVNGDGLADAVVATVYGQLDVLLGNGAGQWSAPTHYTTATNAGSPRITDLNHDHIADIVSVDVGDDEFVVMLGTGGGAFAPPVSYTTTPYTNDTNSPTIGDFNGDGHPDLASGSDAALVMALGTGTGTFGATFPVIGSGTIGGRPVRTEAADFDGDGADDLAFLDIDNDRVGFLHNLGNATFAAPIYTPVVANPSGDWSRFLTMADVNKDGRPDLITASDFGRINVLLNTSVPEPGAGLLLLACAAAPLHRIRRRESRLR